MVPKLWPSGLGGYLRGLGRAFCRRRPNLRAARFSVKHVASKLMGGATNLEYGISRRRTPTTRDLKEEYHSDDIVTIYFTFDKPVVVFGNLP